MIKKLLNHLLTVTFTHGRKITAYLMILYSLDLVPFDALFNCVKQNNNKPNSFLGP